MWIYVLINYSVFFLIGISPFIEDIMALSIAPYLRRERGFLTKGEMMTAYFVFLYFVSLALGYVLAFTNATLVIGRSLTETVQ